MLLWPLWTGFQARLQFKRKFPAMKTVTIYTGDFKYFKLRLNCVSKDPSASLFNKGSPFFRKLYHDFINSVLDSIISKHLSNCLNRTIWTRPWLQNRYLFVQSQHNYLAHCATDKRTNQWKMMQKPDRPKWTLFVNMWSGHFWSVSAIAAANLNTNDPNHYRYR